MGANTSRPGGVRESLYELLNVSSDADNSELKRAYRQKALELHPDRNFSNEEEATALFAKVQAAYDILTDPQERQWYDQHRKGQTYDQYDENITTAADVKYVLAQILGKPAGSFDFEQIEGYFQKLKNEELEAAFEQGVDAPASIVYAPAFGGAHESWDGVRKFYDAWGSFATLKSYAWEDIYPVHAAHDRKTRRKFEQSNKKVRDSAKREFNAAVRQAVLLLRARDPRKPHETSSGNKQKQEELAAKVQAEQSKRTEEMRKTYEEQEWQKPTELLLDLNIADESGVAAEPLECVACEETFETDFDLQDHKRSKKHKRAVAALKALMIQEEELMGRDPNASPPSQPIESETVESATEPPKKLGKAKAKAKKKQRGQMLLKCGTCGIELPGEELIQHKKITRHP